MTEMLQKAENLANKNSQDLTEQYKHGKLPDDRYYYYRFKDDPDVQITTQYGLYCEEEDNKKEIEVIDFVPSYEEYEQLENWNRFTADYHALREAKEIAEYEKFELVEKMKQLKELLKECREVILDYNHWIMSANPNDSELILRINEVLNA